MDFPLLLTIRIDNADEYELMKRAFADMKDYCGSDVGMSECIPLLERMQLRRTDGKQARLRINGVVVATGNLEEMTIKFQTECGMHSRSNIALDEWVDGSYNQVKVRNIQPTV